MDVTPVYQAIPPFIMGVSVLMLGLVAPGRFAKYVAVFGAFVALLSAGMAAVYVGLGLACQAWDRNPQATWLVLVSLMLLTATTVAIKSTRTRRGDDDSDDDGGQRVRPLGPPPPMSPTPAPEPAPTGPALDWEDFDGLREGWERTPVGV